MAALVVPNVVRFFINFVLGSRDSAVIQDMLMSGGSGSRADGCSQLAGYVIDAWHDGPRTRQSNNISCTSVSWIDLDSLTGSTGTAVVGTGGSPTWPAPGGVAEPSMPSNVALRVDKRVTASRGNRNGRMYVPGVSESDTDVPNQIASTRLAAWQTEFTEFLTALDDLSLPTSGWLCSPVVVHQPASGSPSSSLVTSMQVQQTLRSQGRRLRG